MLAKRGGLDLAQAFEVIRASSGNSFVHETESQLILNGSYNINFTMDLACKDLGFALGFGREFGVPLDLAALTAADLPPRPRSLRRRGAVDGGRQAARGRACRPTCARPAFPRSFELQPKRKAEIVLPPIDVAEVAHAEVVAGGPGRHHQRQQVLLARMTGAAGRRLGPVAQRLVALSRARRSRPGPASRRRSAASRPSPSRKWRRS